jgi:hypothetical protein
MGAELLIHSYFNIVKREMIDMVPKAISLTLVNYSKENLQRELLQELYKPEVLDELLKESDHVVTRRKELVQMVGALNKAEECVPLSLFLYFLSLVGMLTTCTQDCGGRVESRCRLLCVRMCGLRLRRLAPPRFVCFVSCPSRLLQYTTNTPHTR